jgi:Tfp pilus assembly protein PilW
MKRLPPVGDERGTTLTELMVGVAAGMVVIMALSMLILATMHGVSRVSARVEATQQGRIAIARVMEQLHSACIAPEVTPVKENSSGTLLRFVHQTGSSVSPTPILSEISLSGGALSQADFSATGGTAPNWTFASTPSATRQLLTGVAPIPGSTGIFYYYAYINGTPSSAPLTTPLISTDAARTILVRVALNVTPDKTTVADSGADASIQDSASLRLTPPSFNEKVTSLPCR